MSLSLTIIFSLVISYFVNSYVFFSKVKHGNKALQPEIIYGNLFQRILYALYWPAYFFDEEGAGMTIFEYRYEATVSAILSILSHATIPFILIFYFDFLTQGWYLILFIILIVFQVQLSIIPFFIFSIIIIPISKLIKL